MAASQLARCADLKSPPPPPPPEAAANVDVHALAVTDKRHMRPCGSCGRVGAKGVALCWRASQTLCRWRETFTKKYRKEDST